MLVSTASATSIDSITTNPERPTWYGDYPPRCRFGGSIHVVDPPLGGYLLYGSGAEGYQFPSPFLMESQIDENGMAAFGGSVDIYEPNVIYLRVCDANGNVVASAEKVINIYWAPTITWNPPGYISDRTQLSSTQLNAVATRSGGYSVPGTFVYTPAEGTVLSAGTHTLHVDFTPDDTATYNTASKDVTIEVVTPGNPPIIWSNPEDIISGTPLSSKQLNAVTPSPVSGTFVYTPVEGTVLSAGTHTLHVDFIPGYNEISNTASADVTINVLNPTSPPETSVPEFPSVVVPVVAVLGMIAIIGRRKE